MSDSEEEDPLSWRMDPEISLADWTIEILPLVAEPDNAHKKAKCAAVYHVHKVLLSVGPKQSKYFAALFRSKTETLEMREKTIRIKLHNLASDAFPTFLDYFYAPHVTLAQEHSVGLHHLATYFDVAKLSKDVQEFWKSHLSLQNVGLYYEQAKILVDEKLVSLIIKKCCDLFEAQEWAGEKGVIESFDSSIWLEILKLIKNKRNPDLNEAVAEFCHHERDQMDAETFTLFTTALSPVASWKVAFKLMEAEKHIMPPKSEGQTLSLLQEQCIDVLVTEWQNISLDEDAIVNRLSMHSPIVLSTILAKTCKRSQLQQNRFSKEMEGCVPFSVNVENAGNEAVNGIYSMERLFEGGVKYWKEGIWKGSKHTFYIFRCNVSNNREHWYISIVRAGKEPGFCSDIDFYSAPRTKDSLRVPPKRGWVKAAEGTDHVPNLFFGDATRLS